MKLDDVNLAIIRHLRDGRKPYSAIAADLGITENTVRARVNRMVKEGVLDIAGTVDPDHIPGHRTIIVGVKLATTRLMSKAEEFLDLRGVVKVHLVTGKYDVIFEAMLNDEFGLLEFYEQEFSKVMADVQNAETFVTIKSFNHHIPYVL